MSTTTKPRGAKKPPKQAELFEDQGPSITRQLRQAIDDSGLSAYRLAASSGVNVAAVLRFRSGESSLTLKSVDAIARVLGLELTKRKGK